MFNSVEKIYKMAIPATKDNNCFVAIGRMGYNYTIRIQWTQRDKLRSLQKAYSVDMVHSAKSMYFNDFILEDIEKEIEYNVGKVAYEED